MDAIWRCDSWVFEFAGITPDRQALIHHSDRGLQYASIRYNERLAEAGIELSVGSKGDNYDNALAETINGLYKNRDDSSTQRIEDSRGGRNGKPWMGILVQ